MARTEKQTVHTKHTPNTRLELQYNLLVLIEKLDIIEIILLKSQKPLQLGCTCSYTLFIIGLRTK